jgi:hypothetical protein
MIRMFAEFWDVGATQSSPLAMDAGNVSNHLVADWIPSLPVNLSASFVGWPPILLEPIPFDGYDVLSVCRAAGRSERQWKSVLSWMLGVAGTRHFLARDGYRWIAPLSAFYPEAVQQVDLSAWHPMFPIGVVEATLPPDSQLRLRPDYLAIRPRGESLEWAVVESKGTRRCMTSARECPPRWYRQARNIVVKVNGTPREAPRHVVVATRVNPQGKRERTRRVQIRAWNSTSESRELSLPAEAAADIAAAHVFGLFKNLRLWGNARAVASAPWRRTKVLPEAGSFAREESRRLREDADLELKQRTERRTDPIDEEQSAVVSIDTDLGPVEIEVSAPLTRFARRLQTADTDSDAIAALRDVNVQLDRWQRSRLPRTDEHPVAVLPIGVQVRLPRGFERRDR